MKDNQGSGLARRLSIMVGVVVVIMGVGIGGFYAWGWLNHQSANQHQVYRHPVRGVDVETRGVDVTLVSGRDGEVVVDRTLSWSYSEPEIVEVWDGDVLRISTSCASGLAENGCSVRYRVVVPAAAAIGGEVTSGNIELDGIHGGVRLSTHSSDVTTSATGGPLWLRSSSGSVNASGLNSTDVDVESTSGDVRLDFSSGPRTVRADVRSGDLDIDVPRPDAYNVDASVRSGDRTIDVTQDQSSARRLDVRTSSGNLHIWYGKS